VAQTQADGRFYVTGLDTSTAVQSLGVIDAETSTWLQMCLTSAARIRLPSRNPITSFTVVQITAAMVAAPATDNSTCTQFGLSGRGASLCSHALEADR